MVGGKGAQNIANGDGRFGKTNKTGGVGGGGWGGVMAMDLILLLRDDTDTCAGLSGFDVRAKRDSTAG